jgi:uncharacterized protein with HEPN domain
MSKRNPSLLLTDILDAINRIEEYTIGYDFEKFLNDSKTKDAVVRNFEIIGEAANQIPDTYKTSHTSVPWNKITGVRNRVIHEYFGVDYQILWTICETNLPDLKKNIMEILDKESK